MCRASSANSRSRRTARGPRRRRGRLSRWRSQRRCSARSVCATADRARARGARAEGGEEVRRHGGLRREAAATSAVAACRVGHDAREPCSGTCCSRRRARRAAAARSSSNAPSPHIVACHGFSIAQNASLGTLRTTVKPRSLGELDEQLDHAGRTLAGARSPRSRCDARRRGRRQPRATCSRRRSRPSARAGRPRAARSRAPAVVFAASAAASASASTSTARPARRCRRAPAAAATPVPQPRSPTRRSRGRAARRPRSAARARSGSPVASRGDALLPFGHGARVHRSPRPASAPAAMPRTMRRCLRTSPCSARASSPAGGRARIRSRASGAPLRLAFVGQATFFEACALDERAARARDALRRVPRGRRRRRDARGRCGRSRPHVVVVFRPEILPAGVFADLRAAVLGFLTEPIPRTRGGRATPTSSAGARSCAPMDAGNVDRLVAFDPLIAPTAEAVHARLALAARCRSPTASSRRSSACPAGRRVLFVGRSTAHRERFLAPPEGRARRAPRRVRHRRRRARGP